jgi:hypothetical protein
MGPIDSFRHAERAKIYEFDNEETKSMCRK